jgi:hypothetical protein
VEQTERGASKQRGVQADVERGVQADVHVESKEERPRGGKTEKWKDGAKRKEQCVQKGGGEKGEEKVTALFWQVGVEISWTRPCDLRAKA